MQSRPPLLAPGGALRIAVRKGDLRSRYWKVRSSASRPEVFVSPEGLGRWLHISAHENTDYWQFTVTDAGTRHRQTWSSTEREPGIVRILMLEVRPAIVRHPAEPAPKDVLWIGSDMDGGTVLVELFLVGAGRDDSSTHLGAAGTGSIIGAGLRLTDGSTAIVVASDVLAGTTTMTVPRRVLTPDQIREMRETVASGNLGMMAFGSLVDGSLLVMDGLVDPTSDVSVMAEAAPDEPRPQSPVDSGIGEAHADRAEV